MNDLVAIPTVADVEIDPIPCIGGDATVQEAAQVLDQTRRGAVVVMAEPWRIVTDHDVVAATAAGLPPTTPVCGMDVGRCSAVRKDAPLADALRLMLERECTSLVVVDSRERIVGVVSLRHVVSAVLGGPPWIGALRLALRIEGRAP